ncbi:MAG: hypothetical protein ABIO81_10735 [Ginsengibacter sp.]
MKSIVTISTFYFNDANMQTVMPDANPKIFMNEKSLSLVRFRQAILK